MAAQRQKGSMLSEPVAVPGCSDCLGFGVRRQNARSTFDYSTVSDVNVQWRRHLAAQHEGA